MIQNKQRGIALIQVLLLTGILAVLVLYFTQTSRQQVALATYANDRALALVNLQSAKSLLLFKLLSEHKLVEYQDNVTSENSSLTALNWNFHGAAFEVINGVKASLQDQSGLISAHFLDGELLNKILLANGVEATEANNVFTRLLDWQDIDNLSANFSAEKNTLGLFIRNGHIPDLTDLTHVSGISPDIFQLLQQIMTIHYAGRFNPMTAPEPVLKGMLNEQAYLQIKTMREDNTLSKQQFSAVSRIREAEDIWFTPSNFLQMSITSKVGEVSLSQSWMMVLNPYASVTSPVNYLETRG
jgi:general secretion pathway protein K